MGVVGDFVGLVVFAFAQVVFSVVQLIVSPFVFVAERLKTVAHTTFKSVLITGGSSGLGAALAEEYAGKGVHITITGRNEQRLREVARKCEAKGATVTCEVLDVTEREKLVALVNRVDAEYPLDLVIANAGISGFVESSDESYTVLQSVIDVTNTNVLGVAHTIFPAIAKMCARKHGQVVVMGSLSGNFPLQASPEYGAGKGYLKSLCQSLRRYLAIYNVGLTLLEPGFVRTPMLSSPKKYPHEVPQDAAIPIITDHIARNVGFVPFPLAPAVLTQLLGSLHPLVFEFLGPLLMTRLHRKVTARLLLTDAEASKKKK